VHGYIHYEGHLINDRTVDHFVYRVLLIYMQTLYEISKRLHNMTTKVGELPNLMCTIKYNHFLLLYCNFYNISNWNQINICNLINNLLSRLYNYYDIKCTNNII